MSHSLPPPTYSQQHPDHLSLPLEDATDASDLSQHPQLLIVPSIDTVNFQKGFLGAEDERAAIEGELQIKGAETGKWKKVTVCLRTVEKAFSREIELNCSEVVLWSRSAGPTSAPLPSSMLFAIPLMPDAPQSVTTPHSSLSHTLTASLYPVDPLSSPLSKSLNVHTRRYTSHLHSLLLSPETHSLDDPTRIEVEVPRTTYKVGELIPLYVKIPPPRRELVIDEQLRLRNVKAELVRVVKVKRDDDEVPYAERTPDEPAGSADGSEREGLSATLAPEKPAQTSSSKAPVSPIFSESSYRATLARSGASCRFHSSRAIQLRFIMHRASPFSSPSNNPPNLPNSEHEHLDDDAEFSSITQQTLLHSVTFRVDVHVSFVNVGSRTERISTISIPITLLPPSASLPEVGPSMDEAYQKKHDRPPVKTNRYEDTDFAPHYSEGEAGPSALPNSAPPPFEERDAPPPFFSSAAEASTSAHLPTFLESEREIIIPPDPDDTPEQPLQTIAGEGFEFGFTISEQFDGHSEDMQRSSTPPPTLEMASRDANVTQLADMAEPERAIEALGLVLTQQQEDGAQEEPPPPPPALDDPSDPPPSIDSDFRSPDAPRQRSPSHASPPPLRPGYSPEPPQLHTDAAVPSLDLDTHGSHGHAPPPYLVPENHAEHVIRPPPYVD